MSNGRRTRLSSSELYDYAFSHRIYDGIEQAEEGSSPDRQPWYDDASPYTSYAARCENAQLNWGDPPPLAATPDTVSTSTSTSTSTTSFLTATEGDQSGGGLAAFPQAVQEEEDVWNEDLADRTPHTHGVRGTASVPQRASPRDGGSSPVSPDAGGFLGGPLGGGHPDEFRSYRTQGGTSSAGSMDGELPSMEGSAAQDPAPHESRTTRWRRGLMSGLRLGVFKFTYTIRLTIQLTVPRVMCLCVT
jgi:hypothetical protein